MLQQNKGDESTMTEPKILYYYICSVFMFLLKNHKISHCKVVFILLYVMHSIYLIICHITL